MKFKTFSYAMPTKMLKKLVNDLDEAGYQTEYNYGDGTATASLDGSILFRALRTHTTWIVRAHPELLTIAD